MEGKESKVRFPSNLLGRFAKIFLLVGLLSILPTIMLNMIDRTIHGMRLTWIGILIGLVLALLVMLILKKRYPNPYAYDKLNIHICFFVGFMSLCPALCNYINIGFSNPEITCQSYTLVEKTSTRSNGRHFTMTPNCYIIIYINNRKEHFQVYNSIYEKLHEGGQVKLYVKHGALGFDYVEKFEAPTGF